MCATREAPPAAVQMFSIDDLAKCEHICRKAGHDPLVGAYARVFSAALYSSGLNPTSKRPSEASTGRVIIEGCASISLMALPALSAALSLSGNLRKVVPVRFNKVSQPSSLHQASRRFRSIPSFL